jgi:UDPglucose 6-dehydrogenase
VRISVIGCGYLGAVHAACMTKLGHDVVGIDVEPARVESLRRGEAPFFEPGLQPLLGESLASGRLRFSTDIGDARGAAAHFICVGTPQTAGEFKADLSQVHASVRDLADHLAPGDVVVGKSTVPVGTAEQLTAMLGEHGSGAVLAWNPEFLREGFAVKDTLSPDRLVYGLPDGEGRARARSVLNEIYDALLPHTPLVETDIATAQMVKVAANSFLATKISFINAMAEFCEAAGADVVAIADAIGLDDRIGRRFLDAGLGFGGGCLPKDIRAFMARADELGVDQALSFLREVDAINMRRRTRMVDLAREECGGSVAGRRVAVLGAAFKPNSDDIRDSPALNVALQMQLQGAHVTVTDPQAVPNASARYPELRYELDVEDAARDAELVLLLTEWEEYKSADPYALKPLVAIPRILDGRNALEPEKWRAAGWTYRALGRRQPIS